MMDSRVVLPFSEHAEDPCLVPTLIRSTELHPPTFAQSVYREDCTQCFDSIVSPIHSRITPYALVGLLEDEM